MAQLNYEIILENFITKRIDINVLPKNFSDDTEFLKSKLRETEEKFINDNNTIKILRKEINEQQSHTQKPLNLNPRQ